MSAVIIFVFRDGQHYCLLWDEGRLGEREEPERMKDRRPDSTRQCNSSPTRVIALLPV